METTYKDILDTFTADELPDLDVVVLGALEMLAGAPLPHFDTREFQEPLVIGSGNAAVVGGLLFSDVNARVASESTYREALLLKAPAEVIVISSSGGKHAAGIAKDIKERNLPLWLITNRSDAPAREYVSPERVVVYPKNREPYTYNASTYMSMLLGKTKEDPESIRHFIEKRVAPLIPANLGDFDAFFFLVPEKFDGMREMFTTKFEELFGPEVAGNVFTFEEAKHAKTVVPSSKELFVSFGVENTVFGREETRIFVPLPEGAREVAMMAVGYFVIGQIQKQHPPYFKENITEYVKEASRLFNQHIPVIVE